MEGISHSHLIPILLICKNKYFTAYVFPRIRIAMFVQKNEY